MNWAGIAVTVGVLAVVAFTLPWGLVLLAGLWWMLRRS